MVSDRQRRRVLAGVAVLTAIAVLGVSAPAQAAGDNPLFRFSPRPAPPPLPPNPPPPPVPPPNGYLNDPCGLAVDLAGSIYVADHCHDAVDLYSANADYTSFEADGETGYLGQLLGAEHSCGLALDVSGNLYAAAYHGDVAKYGPSPSFGPGTEIDSGPATGVAVDPGAPTSTSTTVTTSPGSTLKVCWLAQSARGRSAMATAWRSPGIRPRMGSCTSRTLPTEPSRSMTLPQTSSTRSM